MQGAGEHSVPKLGPGLMVSSWLLDSSGLETARLKARLTSPITAVGRVAKCCP